MAQIRAYQVTGPLTGVELAREAVATRWEMLTDLLVRYAHVVETEPSPAATALEMFWTMGAEEFDGPFTLGQLRHQWQAGRLNLQTHFKTSETGATRLMSEIVDRLESPAANAAPNGGQPGP